MIIASLFWPRMTIAGAAAGMIAGAGTALLWARYDPFGWGLYELLPAFIAGSIAIVLFNGVGRPPEREWEGATGERVGVR